MNGSLFVPIALLGWPLAAFCLFLLLRPRTAVLTTMVLGWAFLPIAGYALEGFPDYNKVTSLSFGLLLGALAFDSRRLLAFRPRWIDGIVGLFCLVPIGSSLANGLGFYDGLSAAVGTFLRWGVPYLMGRIYFRTEKGLRALAAGIVLGGALYTPLCLYEIRMSPQLHTMVYGYHQHQFAQTKRFGGWRPVVFLEHGLAVGMWMASAALLAVGLAASRPGQRLLGLPTYWVAAVLVVMTVLVKSAGAAILLFGGLAIAVVIWTTRFKGVAYALVLSSLLYVLVRTTGFWSGEEAVELSRWISESHAGSLSVRLNSETVLIEHALERPWFGWGGWKRNRPLEHRDIVTDGYWVIELAQHGLLGLGAMLASILTPGILALRRARVRGNLLQIFLALLLGLYMIDNLLNAMFNPLIVAVAGGLGGWALAPPRPKETSQTSRSRRGFDAPEGAVQEPIQSPVKA